MTIERAIATYLQDVQALGREPKTVQWHQTSLFALQQYLWQRFQLTDVRQLSRALLQSWLTDLHTAPSAQTGARLAVNSIAAYARSARAFCNWLARQEYVPETPLSEGEKVRVNRRRWAMGNGTRRSRFP
jgi:site-specific recombinase XerC